MKAATIIIVACATAASAFVPDFRPRVVAPRSTAVLKSEAADTSGAVGVESPALEGFTKTDSGLQFKDLTIGSGEQPKEGGWVSVHYTGFTSTGGVPQSEFDNSRARGYPFKFVMGDGRVIKGWEEGIKTMAVGGTRKLIIPAELAYGNVTAAGGKIPANSEIQFECELMDVGREGTGTVEIMAENAKINIANTFENKFFTVFFFVWLVSFLAPRDFFETFMDGKFHF